MTEVWEWAALYLAGMILAALYFGGLWWTIRTIPHASHPWLLYFGSTAVRLSLLLASLFLLMAGDWRRAVACLAGFLSLRIALLYRFTGTIAVSPRPTGNAIDG
jgi:F1F0 ATPase subunit 2